MTANENNIKLIFSSFGFNSPIMREKFSKVISCDESLAEKRCLVLPYAGFNVENTFEREKIGLTEFGFSPKNIVFVRKREDVICSPPDYIYVSGGDPYKLLKALRELGLLEDIAICVKEKNAVYIGVSAGADIATKSIEYVTRLEDNNVIEDGNFEALSLISETILCHYDHRSYFTLKECERISGNRVMTINDDQLLIYENGIWKYAEEEEI